MTDAAGAVLEVDLGAVAANWRTLSARHPSGPVAGVVKADAYGLGAAEIAPALLAAGCRHFFVALPQEALSLRPLLPDAFLGVLNGLLPGSAQELAAQNIVPALGSLRQIEEWAKLGAQLQRRLPAIVHVDTGMARLGLSPSELSILASEPARLAGIEIRYVMTHLVSSEVADDPLNQAQRKRFDAACAVLPRAPRSFANSSGIFLGQAFGSDLARPGAALYGINPTPGAPNPMRQAAQLSVQVLAVREIKPGETVGYNATWTAQRRSRIATAAIGYADGWHRSLSNRGRAFFDGRPVPLVGRVSMDLATFDVTDEPAILPGATLLLLGPEQTADDVAAEAGTNGYEVLTSLGRRFRRVYRPA